MRKRRLGRTQVNVPASVGLLGAAGSLLTFPTTARNTSQGEHRGVTSLNGTPDGSVSFRAKGDADKAADPCVATVGPHATMGRVPGVIPRAGTAPCALLGPVVGGVLGRDGLGALAQALLAMIRRRPEASDPAGALEPPLTGDRPISP